MPAKKKYELTVDLYVRFPADMHAQIKTVAQKEHRSLNAQVIALVQEALASRPNPAGDVPAGAAMGEG